MFQLELFFDILDRKRIRLYLSILVILFLPLLANAAVALPLRIQDTTTQRSFLVCNGETLTIRYLVEAETSAPIVVRIFNDSGALIRTLGPTDEITGQHEMIWDGRNDLNMPVDIGNYFYQIARNDAALDSDPSPLKDGLKVDATLPQEANGVYSPAVIRLYDGRLRMFYSGFSPGANHILSAISVDEGATWMKEGVRFQVSASTGSGGNPTATRLDDGRVRIYYVAPLGAVFEIRSKISTDSGLTFVDEGSRLQAGPAGSYDAQYPTYPEIVRLPVGGWRLYYEGYDGTYGRILSATSPDGLFFTKDNGIRIDIGGPGSYDANQAMSPSVRRLLNGTWEMIYAGNSGGGPRLLRATSPDGTNWTKGSVPYLVGGSGEGIGIFEPGFAELKDGTRRILYSSAAPYRIFSATQSEGETIIAVCIPPEFLRLQNITTQQILSPGDLLTVRYHVAAETVEPIVVRVFDETGSLVRTLGPVLQGAGLHQQLWDGRDGFGMLVSPGRYSYQIARTDAAFDTRLAYLKEPGIRLDIQSGMEATGVLDPAVVRLPGGQLRMYYTGFQRDVALTLMSALSNDGGLSWIREGSRFQMSATNAGGAASVVRLDDGRLRVYYVAQPGAQVEIHSAVTSDGLNFTLEGRRLGPGTPGSYDAVYPTYPFVVRLPDGRWRMFYAGLDGSRSRILSAVSDDGLTFDRDAGVRVDVGGPYDSIQAFAQSVRRLLDGNWEMLYSGQNSSTTRILRATSTDGFNWVKDTQVWIEPGVLQEQGVLKPEVVYLPDGTRRILHHGTSSDLFFRIFSASASEVGTIIVAPFIPQPLRIQDSTIKRSFLACSGETLVIRYLVEVETSAPIVVRIYNETGIRIRTLGPADEVTGMYVKIWDGMNDTGNLVPPGSYTYQIAGQDAPLISSPSPLTEGLKIGVTFSEESAGVFGQSIIRPRNDLLRMYYSGFREASTHILSAVSSDMGTTWIKEGVRFEVSSTTRQGGSPSAILLEDGRVRLYYVECDGPSYEIKSLISNDGLSFALEGVSLLAGSFASIDSDISYPDVIRLPDGRWRMYYDAFDGSHDRILSATSDDGLSFTKDAGIRIDVGPAGSIDARQALSPSVRRLPDGSLEMLYSGNSGDSPRILRATSADGLTWTKAPTPFLASSPGEGTGLFEPAVAELPDGTRRLFYSSQQPYLIFSALLTEADTILAAPCTGVNQAPIAPEPVLVDGSSGIGQKTCNTAPVIGWTFRDSDAGSGDEQSAFEVQISNDSIFGTIQTSGMVNSGAGLWNTSPALTASGTYWIRVRTWDTLGGIVGPFTSGRDSFVLDESAPVLTITSVPSDTVLCDDTVTLTVSSNEALVDTPLLDVRDSSGNAIAIGTITRISASEYRYATVPIPLTMALGNARVTVTAMDTPCLNGSTESLSPAFTVVDQAPAAPEPILVDGLGGLGQTSFNPAPVIGWTFDDSDAGCGDTQSAFEVQISRDSLFSAIQTSGKVNSGAETWTVSPALSASGTYWIRVRTWDAFGGVAGPFTSGLDSFVLDTTPLAFSIMASPLVIAACETSHLIIVASHPLAAVPTLSIVDASNAVVPFSIDGAGSSGNLYSFIVGSIPATLQTGYCTITATGTRLSDGSVATQAENRALFLQVDPFHLRVNPPAPGRILPGFETTRIAFELTRAASVTIVDMNTGGTLLGPLPYSSGVHEFDWGGDAHSNETVAVRISAVDLCVGSSDMDSVQVFVEGPGGGTPAPILRNFVLTESVSFPASFVTLQYIIEQNPPAATKEYATTLKVIDRFGVERDSAVFITDSGAPGGLTNVHAFDVSALTMDEPYLFLIQSIRTQPPLANGMTNTLAAVTVVLRNDVNRAADTGAPSVVTVMSETTGVSVMKTSMPSAGAIGLRSNGGFLAGDVYEIEPSGTTLVTPAVVSFRVTGNQMPEKLGIYRLDTDGVYQPESSLVDPRTRTIYAVRSSFSRYALLVPAYLDATPPDIRSAEIAPRLFSPNGDGVLDAAGFRFDVRDNLVRPFPSARIDIFNETGATVGSLLGNGSIFYGASSFSWSGAMQNGLVPLSGRYSACLSTTDIAGNRAVKSLGGFTIDVNPPSISIEIEGDQPGTGKYDELVLKPKTIVTIAAADQLAGVATLEWKVDAGEFQAYTNSFAIGEILARARGDNPKDDTHVLVVRSVDAVGNVAETTLVFRQASNGQPRGESSVQTIETEKGTLLITSQLAQTRFRIGEEIVLRITYTNPPDVMRPNNPNPTPDGGQTLIRILDANGNEISPQCARPAPNPPRITIGNGESLEVAYPIIEKMFPAGLPTGRYTMAIMFRGKEVGEHRFEVLAASPSP